MRDISVIISTYAKARLDGVRRCIDSLKDQSLPPKEIVLVLDPDEDLVEFYKSRINSDVKIVVSDEFGLSHARNAGIGISTGEIVAFIDDDAFAHKEWLRALTGNYDDSNVAGVGGLIKPVWEGKRSIWIPEELDWIVGCSYKGLPKRKSFVRNPIGCNMSFRRSVFGKVGCFSTNIGRFGKRLLAGEEPDLALRVFREIPQAKVVYDPSAIVYHRVPRSRATLRYALKRSFYEGLSKAMIKNGNLGSSKVLSSEGAYLSRLLVDSLPSKLKRWHRFENLCHALAISASTAAVLIGFSMGRFRENKVKK